MPVELCLDASQSFHNLALFSVDIYFRANVTNLAFTRIHLKLDEPKKIASLLFPISADTVAIVGRAVYFFNVSFIFEFLYKFFPFPSF